MTAMWSDYLVPSTLEQALQLLSRHVPQARIIAGGTDLMIEMDRSNRQVGTLIDISRIPGEDAIWLDDKDWIHLSALTTHNQVVASDLCVSRAFPLARACRQVGAPQIRNRATVAGNLITASPANDTITPLMALGAQLTLRSVHGERTMALSNFYTGVRHTVIAPDEVLTDIAFPALRPDQRGTFVKLGLRRAQAISVVNCAIVLTLDGDSPTPERQLTVREATITLGAVAPHIVRAREAETALTGKPLIAEVIEHAASLSQNAATPIDDIRASAAYRRRMVTVITRRALQALAALNERESWIAGPVLLCSPADPLPNLSFSEGTPITLVVNGRSYTVQGSQHKTLLRLLREDLGLVGTKEGCDEGECGVCTVIMDGKAVMACLVPAPRAHGAVITTVEGLATGDHLHPLQQAFVDEGAVQCGYCTPGFLMSGAALFQESPHPSAAQVKEALSGNLCRCTGYYRILKAFERAAARSGERQTESRVWKEGA